MNLCSNRPEGFGPHSHLHPSLATTCFIDTIVIPLATWLYILLIIPVAFLCLRHGSRTSKTRTATRSGWPYSACTILYYLLVIALLAMQSLVLARMSAAHLGIGLLPFTYIGLVVAPVLHFLTGHGFSKHGLLLVAANAAWWFLLAVVTIVSVAAVAKEGKGSRSMAYAELKYPYSDEITDEATMVAVEIILGILELVCWSLGKR